MRELSELELKLRREFYADRDAHLKAQVELAQAIYLLKRVAGWTAWPINDKVLRAEAEMFLRSWGHKPTDQVQGKLIDMDYFKPTDDDNLDIEL